MIIAVTVGILMLAAWFYNRGNAGEAPIYRTATIERGSVKSTVSATGTLSAVKTIQVGTQSRFEPGQIGQFLECS